MNKTDKKYYFVFFMLCIIYISFYTPINKNTFTLFDLTVVLFYAILYIKYVTDFKNKHMGI